MAKKLMAAVGTYKKDGQEKKKYVEVGVILSNDKGEFAILNSEVDLAGVALKQRILNPNSKGDVMCGIFSNDRNNGGSNAQGSAPAPVKFDDDTPF